MQTRRGILWLLTALLALPVWSEDHHKAVLDERVVPFQLTGLDGREVGLQELVREQDKALVLVFWSIRCPVCEKETEALKLTAQHFEELGARFVLVAPNPGEGDDEVREYLEDRGLLNPCYRVTKEVTGRLGVQVTPSYRLLDRELVLRYEGALSKGSDPDATPLLANAIEDVLAGREVSVKTSASKG